MNRTFISNLENDLTFDNIIIQDDKLQDENHYYSQPNKQMIEKFLQNCADLGYGEFKFDSDV